MTCPESETNDHEMGQCDRIGAGRLLSVSALLSDGPPTEAGKPMVAVTVPSLSIQESHGETLFNDNCASCHGVNAAGQYGVAPPLVHVIYEPNHHGDMSFQMAASRGVRQHHWQFGNMPPIPNVSENDVINIVAYVRGLQRANGIH